MRAQIAQLVEQQTENLRVPSSILGLGTSPKRKAVDNQPLFAFLNLLIIVTEK